MKAEILFQFVVPLMFLAIWALTSLLNRDAQPLPQRPVRPGARPVPPGNGGQGGGQGPNRGADFPRERSGAAGGPNRGDGRAPSARPGAERRPPSSPGDARTYVADDEVVFLDPAANRRAALAPPGESSAAAARGGTKPVRPQPVQNRKPNRGRRAPTPTPPSRPETATPRALSDQIGRSMSQSRSRPLDLAPLTSKLAPLSTSTASASAAPARDLGLERSAGGPAIVAREVRSLLGSPLKLRETMVLAEVLQPPIALRGRVRRG